MAMWCWEEVLQVLQVHTSSAIKIFTALYYGFYEYVGNNENYEQLKMNSLKARQKIATFLYIALKEKENLIKNCDEAP